MKYMTALLVLFVSQAFAAQPSYWMKSYPGADQAKVDRCLAIAEEVRNKELKGGVMGSDVPWATLHQGNAWESCMDGKE